MVKSFSRALLRSSSLIILISSSVTLSSAAFANDPLEVVVTADRSEVPLKNTGSAITVITSEEIEKYGSKNIADVLRTVPGLTVGGTGGSGSFGGEAKINIRGASSGSTLVLLDGIPIADPSNTEGYLDFGNFSTSNIERIEILRGPQSALYGSDAMGGVVNIITKKGSSTPRRELTVEAGSFGTIGTRGSLSGSTDKVSYSFGMNALQSDGFPRYGYRISPEVLPGVELKNNKADKVGFNGNISYRINPNVTVETGLAYFANNIEFPDPSAINPSNIYNSNNRSTADILNGYMRTKFSSLDNALSNKLSVFGNQTIRDSWQMEYYQCSDGTSFPCLLKFRSRYLGAEYQGDLNLDKLGVLTFGGRRMTEYASTDQVPLNVFAPINADQTTNSVFAQNRFDVTDRLTVTLGGRLDSVENGREFNTWRSTFAYRIDQTSTKIRGAIGTGAKSPSLYQRYDATYGNPSLLPEENQSIELGVDQSLMSGALDVSATIFDVSYTNKIDYAYDYLDYSCPNGCYYNIAKARSRGIEVSASAEIVPSKWHAKFSYTFMNAIDLDKDRQLPRIPKYQAFISLVYSGIPKLEIEPSMRFVGDRFDSQYSSSVIREYVRFDLYGKYKVDNSNDAYIRFENLTDAHTEDAYNFGSAGRSVYVGWTTRF